MLFHYVSYYTLREAERARRLARESLHAEQDRVQGASAPEGDLYLAGQYWYVFCTREPLSFEQVSLFVAAVPSCGHALNMTQGYM